MPAFVDHLPASMRRRLRGPAAARSAERAFLARATVRHYVDAVVPPGTLRATIHGLPRYWRDRRRYRALSGEQLWAYDDNPQLRDWTPTTPWDPHYTYQDAWAAREIHAFAPPEHVDVGSRVTFVIGVAAFVPTTFIDLRPLDADIPGLSSWAGSVTQMPFGDGSVISLSCLHVAEHVGLGRYGDELDPFGTRKAAAELARVLAPGGRLWFSIPVGVPRTNFNAHRVHDPRDVPGMFPGLELSAFAGVDDAGRFHAHLEPSALAGASWACGLYRFARPAT